MNDSNQYNCHGFNSTLPNGKGSGTLTISDSFIQFTIGDKSERFPLDGSDLKIGGASDRLVFFTHPNISTWRLYTNDRTVLKNPHILDHPTLGTAAKKARGKKISHWILTALVIIAIAATPIALLSRMDLFTSGLAKQVPVEWEEKLGESSLAQYRLGITMMKEDTSNELLKSLTLPLTAALEKTPYTFRFYIAHDSTANAFALPGGYVVIHSGLILRAESAEELLGVLSHEISHITEQHGVRNVIGTAGLYVIASALLGDASGLLATATGAAPFLLSQSYSRKFERQADEMGYQLLLSANINPTGLVTFFEKLLEEEQKRYEKIEDESIREMVKDTLPFLSTHPASDKRIQYLRSMKNTLKTPLNLQTEFEALQNSVRDFTEKKQNTTEE